jgi:hypothetical protein
MSRVGLKCFTAFIFITVASSAFLSQPPSPSQGSALALTVFSAIFMTKNAIT